MSRLQHRGKSASTGEIAMKKTTPPWKKKAPAKSKSGKLTAGQKAAAKARAARAGRRYPNLVDNMWAKQNSKAK
jgi:hypothetical protein